MKPRTLVAGCCALYLLATAYAQPDLSKILNAPGIDYNKAADRALVVQQMQAVENQHMIQARARAVALGAPLRFETPNGGLMELAGLDGDQLIYHTTTNANAAISTAANLVRTSPYNLDGTGLTVGVWDAGAGRITHVEFATGSRMTNVDNVATHYHSMHVSGTIGALGVDAGARGMANNVHINNYDWNSDTSEMTSNGASAPGQADTKLYLSNHSYGYSDGWNYEAVSGTNMYRWRGTGTTTTGYDASFGQYGTTTAGIDALLYNIPYFLPFWSAGNDRSDNPSTGSTVYLGTGTIAYDPISHPAGDGKYFNGFDLIGAHGVSKNVVTIGAVNDAVTSGVRDLAKATPSGFTSWGPADDGRIKPDLVANGVGLRSTYDTSDTAYNSISGTSMASPNACGSATLLVDHYSRLFSGGAMRASTLKGLLIHTADDIGNTGPDYKNGWGLINVKAGADLLIDHQANPNKQRLTEDQVTSVITSKTYQFQWDGVSPIRATLCWTDPAGASTSTHNLRTPRLVNDLDLKIIAPDGIAEYLPFVMPFVGDWTTATVDSLATTGANHTDNVEQVLINAPAQTGTWEVVVSFTGTLTNSQQNYGLLLSGIESAIDEQAPNPNPLTWASPPAPGANPETQITMTATTATDSSGVEYYFAETSGTAGGTDSGWQDSPTYTDSGLFAGTQYTYTVTARDKSTNQNTGTASSPSSATTSGVQDTSPPNPSPATFASYPVASGLNSVIMTATTASDPNGVEYQFTETSGNPGATSSAWQDSPTYEDTGLNSGTPYTYTVTTRDKSPNQNTGTASTAATATTQSAAAGSSRATADIAVSGTITSGSYLNTQASDNNYQQLTEVASGGNPATRYSYLEHKWSFNVTGSDPVTFHVEAYHTANSEGDDFTFAYSTTGANGTYTDMLTVTKTADDNTTQTYQLPPSTSGQVHIRVIDTNNTPGRSSLDSLFIDDMFITAGSGTDTTAPTLVSISDDQAGISIVFNTPVTYTVTFSEDMDAATVGAGDFGNAGTASITFGAINEVNPGVFTVAVTPTTSGSLQLQVNSGADLRDLVGNPMITTAAVTDDVTITVTNVIVNVTLGNLNATYDGTAKPVSVVTNPTPIGYTVTYGGSTDVPVNAGSYEVVVVITQSGYEGSATDTLVISPAATTVTLGDLAVTYDGNPKPASVTIDPPGLSHSVTYDGGPNAPTNANTYAVVATITDPNYTGSDSASLVIAKAAQTISFGTIAPVYDNAAPFELTASVNSPLPLTYTNTNEEVVSLSGSTATVVGLGSTTITASQAGDANHQAATSVPQSLTVVRANPLAVTSGPYKVIVGQSLTLDGSGSFPSYPETITAYQWDLNNDGTFGDVSGATPTAIPFDDLMQVWGMTQGFNTIQLRVTDSSTQTSTVATTVELVLSLQWDANGTGADQTNGGGAWLGTNLWWDGSANTNWVAGSNAIFGGANSNGGSVSLASPTSVNAIIINQHTGTYTLGSSSQPITINGGIDKTAASSTLTISSPVVLGSDQTWTNDASGDLTVSGVISGSGGFTKSGSGRLILSAAQNANNYTGNTKVTGGILQAGTGWSSANNIPGGLSGTGGTGQSNLELNGGTFTQWYYMTRTLGDGPTQIKITGGRSGFTNRQGDNTGRNWRIGDNANNEIVWGTTYFNPSILVLQDAAASPGNATYTIDNKLDLNGATRTIEIGTSSGIINGTVRNSSGTAGLTKIGTGTLILSVAPTYNGNTKVSDGTLQLDAPNTNNDSSIIRIASVATLDLNFSGTNTVDRLYIGGYQMNAGVYKAVGSAASGTELTQIAGTGTLTVTSSPTAYGSWTNNYSSTLADPDPAKDEDSGGLGAGLEWVYGGDPTSASDDAIITPVVVDSDPAVLSYTFRRTDASNTDPGTTITVEYGSNLLGWTAAVPNGNTVVFNTTDDGAAPGVDLVEVRLSRSLAVGNKMFTRIKVEVAP